MKLDRQVLAPKLPLPSTPQWPEGVWDIEAFRHGTMSILLFAPRGHDYQTAHEQDEIYFVVGGHGVFQSGEQQFDFGEGDVLFVPAGKRHRFVEFTDDLVTWAVFYGPKGGEASQSIKPSQ